MKQVSCRVFALIFLLACTVLTFGCMASAPTTASVPSAAVAVRPTPSLFEIPAGLLVFEQSAKDKLEPARQKQLIFAAKEWDKMFHCKSPSPLRIQYYEAVEQEVNGIVGTTEEVAASGWGGFSNHGDTFSTTAHAMFHMCGGARKELEQAIHMYDFTIVAYEGLWFHIINDDGTESAIDLAEEGAAERSAYLLVGEQYQFVSPAYERVGRLMLQLFPADKSEELMEYARNSDVEGFTGAVLHIPREQVTTAEIDRVIMLFDNAWWDRK